MIFTARNIKADKALAIGLVNAVVPQEELMATALKMANGICKNAPILLLNLKSNQRWTSNRYGFKAIAIEVKRFLGLLRNRRSNLRNGMLRKQSKRKRI